MRYPDLKRKTAIVTGASRGIGCGIASILAREGMRLILTARSEEAGLAFAGQLRAEGAECQWVTADVSSATDAQRVFDAAVARYTHVDLLVNNAAALGSKTILEMDEAVFTRTCLNNISINYYLTRLVARQMAVRGQGGNIVGISSVGGLRAHRGMCGYDASKGALDAMTRSMAADLAPYGIRVNGVAPGMTLKPRKRSPEHLARLQEIVQYIPLQRAGTPEDMGEAVAFLASDAAAYITGQVLYVDGGLTAQLTPPGIRV
jgi:3-oxoacyl-[acyl-carrier protein] reductase